MRAGMKLLLLTASAMMVLSFAGSCFAGGNLNFFIGGKSLEEGWRPVENQIMGGLESDFEVGPLSVAVGLLESAGTGTGYPYDYIGETLEFHLGLRMYFGDTDAKPYMGGGLSIVSGTYWYEDILGNEWEDSDSAAGYWASAGILWAMGSFNVGIELGYSSADVTIFNTEMDAGGPRLGMLFGYNW
jgi:hypothetical protein